MGLFDFFKKKQPKPRPQVTAETATEEEVYALLLEKLSDGIELIGFRVERHPDYKALIINGELEIAVAILPGAQHPMLLNLMVLAIHPTHFPNGIEDNLPGIGVTVEDRVNVAVNNYLCTVFKPIAQALGDSDDPDSDIVTVINGEEITFQPKVGDIGVQGNWAKMPSNDGLYTLIRERLPNYLIDQKFNWLKLYAAKMQDGTINADSFLNNEIWPEGVMILKQHAAKWGQPGEFLGLKQFCVIRKLETEETESNG